MHTTKSGFTNFMSLINYVKGHIDYMAQLSGFSSIASIVIKVR